MNALLTLLTLCLASASALRLNIAFEGRSLLQQSQCSGYQGPFTPQHDLQLEVTYLKSTPSAEQLVWNEVLAEYPPGTLFGTAIAHFPSPFTIIPSLKYFKVSDDRGEVIGLQIPHDRCDIVVDFVIYSSCHDACIPAGACVQLDNNLLREETGHEFPFREGCKSLDVSERPRCMDASVSAIGMGLSEEEETPFTEQDVAHLMIMFNTPFPSYLDLKPKDFNVTGPKGTSIKSVEGAMPGNPMNVAYTLTIKHGSISTDYEKVTVCFVGWDTLQEAGMPAAPEKDVCSTYLKSTEKPEFLMPSIEIRKSHAPTEFC